MIKFFDKEGVVKAAMTRAMGVLLPEDANCVFASVENFADAKPELEAGTPVIFYGMGSETRLRINGHPAAPWFYSKNAGYFQAPFLLVDMIVLYDKIKKGEKAENEAVMLSAKVGYRKSAVGILLHDIHPSKGACQSSLERAREEFGIVGSIEEVREKLEKLRPEESGVKDLIGERVIPGVFFDVEGTILNDQGVNPLILAKLEEYEKENKPVTIWTGGDIKEIERELLHYGIKKYPVVSKEVFRGCRVEQVYDDLSEEELKKQYNIKAMTHIHV